jgi:hypothetical protein
MVDRTAPADSLIKDLEQLPESGRALLELLKLGDLTAEHLRNTLAMYPALLDAQYETCIRAIAGQRLADLLGYARTRGVDAAIEEYARKRVLENRQERFEKERHASRQRRRDRESARSDKAAIRRDLRSLSETVDIIRDRFPRRDIEIASRSYDQKEGSPEVRRLWPQFLFRGESSAYPRTTSSLARLRTSVSMPLRGLEDIIRVTVGVRLALEEQLELPRLLAEGFLQHYGYPTELLDVTADLDIAASFASDLRVGDTGAVCVLQTELLQSHMLADLRQHDLAQRPRRQHALAIRIFGDGDLKHPETVRALDLEWLPFQFKMEDNERFIPDPFLLDAHSDQVAGLAQLVLGEYGKIEDTAARWLADRIQPAPTVGVAIRGDDGVLGVRLLPPDEAGIEVYDETWERRQNYEQWSERYPGPERRQELGPDLQACLISLDSVPADGILRVLGPRSMGLEARKSKN